METYNVCSLGFPDTSGRGPVSWLSSGRAQKDGFSGAMVGNRNYKMLTIDHKRPQFWISRKRGNGAGEIVDPHLAAITTISVLAVALSARQATSHYTYKFCNS